MKPNLFGGEWWIASMVARGGDGALIRVVIRMGSICGNISELVRTVFRNTSLSRWGMALEFYFGRILGAGPASAGSVL